MALSASAPPSFERSILSSLALSDPVIVKLPLNRPNIFLSVGTKSTIGVSLVTCLLQVHKITFLVCYLQKDLSGVARTLSECINPPKTIIFCRTKHAVTNVY